jgi:hypothetical protein
MLKTVVISLACLFFFASLGIANNDNSCFGLRPTADAKIIKGIKTSLQRYSYLNKTSRLVDQGEWITIRVIVTDGQIIDTVHEAEAIFDSSDFGLDADTCWIDSLTMVKIGDSLAGYSYMLNENFGFHYFLNHRFLFQVKGRGSVPQLTDTLRSPINSISATYPQPNDTIIRGNDLTVHWVSQNEHNVCIQVMDLANNSLLYYPLIDNGTYTISANDFDTLLSGQLLFIIGRLNSTISYPGFLFLSLSGALYGVPIELQDAPGIEETEGFAGIEKVNNPFATSRISYNLSQPSTLHLEIFDITGKKIRDITEQGQLRGTLSWDKKDGNGKLVCKGIYVYRLRTADKNFYGKFVILR